MAPRAKGSGSWEMVVAVRNVYGRPLVYPACQQSERLARLIGAKTLPPEALATARELGFTFKHSADAELAAAAGL